MKKRPTFLLACVKEGAGPEAAPVFVKQLKHPSPKVRRYALTALVEANASVAESYVAGALSDADESVRIRALLLCAHTGLGSAKIVPQAIRLISHDARGASPPVVRAAIEVVVSRRQANALAAVDADDAPLSAGQAHRFLRSSARPPYPAGRRVGHGHLGARATGIGQGPQGPAPAQQEPDPDVVHAAEEALAGRSTKTMALSSVFGSEVRSAKKL